MYCKYSFRRPKKDISVRRFLISNLNIGILVLSFLTACETKTVLESNTDDHNGGGGGNTQTSSINEFRSARPSKICGKSGWDFLRKEFYIPQCANCHSEGGFAPYLFAHLSLDSAYEEALSIPVPVLLSTSLASKFVRRTSHLDPNGEVYLGIVEWTNNKRACP